MFSCAAWLTITDFVRQPKEQIIFPRANFQNGGADGFLPGAASNPEGVTRPTAT
jgi:hypothetical protein